MSYASSFSRRRLEGAAVATLLFGPGCAMAVAAIGLLLPSFGLAPIRLPLLMSGVVTGVFLGYLSRGLGYRSVVLASERLAMDETLPLREKLRALWARRTGRLLLVHAGLFALALAALGVRAAS